MPSYGDDVHSSVVHSNRRLLDNHDHANFTVRSSETQYTYAYWLDGSKKAVRPQGHQLVTGHVHFTVAGLREGPHVLLVRATDVTGAEDPTPATYKWTVRVPALRWSGLRDVKPCGVCSDPRSWWTTPRSELPTISYLLSDTAHSSSVVLKGGAVSTCFNLLLLYDGRR